MTSPKKCTPGNPCAKCLATEQTRQAVAKAMIEPFDFAEANLTANDALEAFVFGSLQAIYGIAFCSVTTTSRPLVRHLIGAMSATAEQATADLLNRMDAAQPSSVETAPEPKTLH